MELFCEMNVNKVDYGTSETKYSCMYCDKKFNYESDIYRHERIHTGEAPLSCKVCNKPFLFESDLKRHQLRPRTIDFIKELVSYILIFFSHIIKDKYM